MHSCGTAVVGRSVGRRVGGTDGAAVVGAAVVGVAVVGRPVGRRVGGTDGAAVVGAAVAGFAVVGRPVGRRVGGTEGAAPQLLGQVSSTASSTDQHVHAVLFRQVKLHA